jgi:hypothetical protein
MAAPDLDTILLKTQPVIAAVNRITAPRLRAR